MLAWNSCKFIKNRKTKVTWQSLPWQVQLSSGASCSHWSFFRSPPVTCSVNWTWFGNEHIYLRSSGSLSQSTNRVIKSKELSVDLQDRIVWRHRSGEAYRKKSAALKVPVSTVIFIICTWKNFGTTSYLPRAIWSLVKEVTVHSLSSIAMWRENESHLFVKGIWQLEFAKRHLKDSD